MIRVEPKPIFCKRYVDDIYSQRKKSCDDELCEKHNSYHPNIKLTVESEPNKFLDTEIIEKKVLSIHKYGGRALSY